MQEVVAEIDTMNWDIVLFSETRAPSRSREITGGHTLYTSGRGHDATGVGVLVHARHVGKHVSVDVSDWVMYVDLELNGKTFREIAAYIPHADVPAMFVDAIYDCAHAAGQSERA